MAYRALTPPLASACHYHVRPLGRTEEIIALDQASIEVAADDLERLAHRQLALSIVPCHDPACVAGLDS